MFPFLSISKHPLRFCLAPTETISEESQVADVLKKMEEGKDLVPFLKMATLT